jgi:hypothetical protein
VLRFATALLNALIPMGDGGEPSRRAVFPHSTGQRRIPAPRICHGPTCHDFRFEVVLSGYSDWLRPVHIAIISRRPKQGKAALSLTRDCAKVRRYMTTLVWLI